MTMAFLAVVPATVQTAAPESLPAFKQRWWFRKDRLDARPVAWSLINRPEEWDWSRTRNGDILSPHVIVHKPSNHEFWVYGRGFYRLWSADCGCSRAERGQFQRFQQGLFHRAFMQWRDRQYPIDHAHFVEHFVR